jgi:peptide/nickel transport system permease protein
MFSYALKRILLGGVILLFIILLLLLMIHAIPGDPSLFALGRHATPEMRAAFRQRMGLDDGLLVQYVKFLALIVTGDFGVDARTGRPILTMIAEVLPDTLALAAASLVWSVTLGILLGCIATIRRGAWPDWLIGGLSVGAVGVPSFVVALYALLAFAVALHWFPAIGAGREGDFLDQARALVLPSFAIGLGWVGYIARLVRAAMIEAMGENYVRTLRAFGVPRRRIILKYALRQALLGVVSVVAIGFGGLLSGSVFAEIVFSRPGIGRLTYDAVSTRSFPVVMATVFVTTALYVTAMVVADLVIARLDPRVRNAL